MTNKKTEELNESELENVQGGVYTPEFKKVIDDPIKATAVADRPSSGVNTKIQGA